MMLEVAGWDDPSIFGRLLQMDKALCLQFMVPCAMSQREHGQKLTCGRPMRSNFLDGKTNLSGIHPFIPSFPPSFIRSCFLYIFHFTKFGSIGGEKTFSHLALAIPRLNKPRKTENRDTANRREPFNVSSSYEQVLKWVEMGSNEPWKQGPWANIDCVTWAACSGVTL